MSVARWSRNITLKMTPMTCASDGSMSSELLPDVQGFGRARRCQRLALAPRRITGLSGCCSRNTTVAEECRSARCLEPHRLKDQRNRRRRANVVGGDLRRQRHPPAAIPHGMALHSLNEQVALARVVIGRRNGERVKMSALDVFLDPVAVEMGCGETAEAVSRPVATGRYLRPGPRQKKDPEST